MAWSLWVMPWLWEVLGFFLASKAATRLSEYEVETLKVKEKTEGTHLNQSGPLQAIFCGCHSYGTTAQPR